MEIKIQGKRYRAKSIGDLRISELTRFVSEFERASANPSEFESALKKAALVLVPVAASDSRNWGFREIIQAWSQLIHYFKDALRILGEISERFRASVEGLQLNMQAHLETRDDEGEV